MSIKNILVPVDFEPPSRAALERALELGEALGAKVHLLHVYAPIVVPTSSGVGVTPHEALQRDALDATEALAAPYRESASLGRRLAAMGNPVLVVQEVAEELAVDLIVLGTHGRGGVRRMVLGSVAQAILRAVHCPVLLVRGVEHPENPPTRI